MQFTEEIGKEYLKLWQNVVVRSEKLSAVREMAERMLSKKNRYEKVSAEFGCPWWWVGLIHAMESGCDFSTWLANGDSLKGPTTHVPRGLQCDGTWEDGARVSLKHHGMPPKDDWSLARCFYEFERYNGFGYRQHGDVSDYLWSFTNHERAGRYVADGKWSPTAWSEQPSCGAMLKYLQQIGAITLDGVRSVDERVTWLEYHRLDEGGVITTGVVAYAGADPLVTWTGTSKAARDDFERRFKNVANCPMVAPPTKPWPTLQPVEKPKPRLVLKKVQPEQLDSKGLYPMTLALMVGDVQRALFSVRSGAPGRQVFQKGGTGEIPGTLYPCPQGAYSVEDIKFAGGKDNYSVSHGPGLGPVFVPFEPKFSTKRGSFGIHLDDNYATAAGSAGCIVVRQLQDLKNLVEVLREYDPKVLIVDWGL